jgi:5-amino-6-(D-ribitylamino)uracil---L-tyrosine 4-hydroxyphenyl transferase
MENIYERSLAGEITKEDALMLVDSNPFQLFDIVDKLREKIVGDNVTFVVNRNIDITDHCMINCAFCSFKNNIGYEMTIDEILQNVGEAKKLGATEICLFGGVMPHMDIDYYWDIISAIKTNYDIELHALSPVEIYHAA